MEFFHAHKIFKIFKWVRCGEVGLERMQWGVVMGVFHFSLHDVTILNTYFLQSSSTLCVLIKLL